MLLIEQNLGVAIDVADRIGVMVNGRIAHEMPAAELGADRELQERLLGLRAGAGDDDAEARPRRRRTTRRRGSSRCAAPTATVRRRWTTSRRARCAASTAGTPAGLQRQWRTSLA